MTAIVAANFDWSIESCDKASRDLNYERNTEKYGRAMKLTIKWVNIHLHVPAKILSFSIKKRKCINKSVFIRMIA